MIKGHLPDTGFIWGRNVLSLPGCPELPSEGQTAALLAGMYRINKEVVRSLSASWFRERGCHISGASPTSPAAWLHLRSTRSAFLLALSEDTWGALLSGWLHLMVLPKDSPEA